MQSKVQNFVSGQISSFESISRMSHIAFSNNPKFRTDQNSPTDVRAEITYMDINGKKLLDSLQGRWVDTDEPPQLKNSEKKKIESIDFPNNGGIRFLDLFF
jgi:hypothetical protein